MYLVQTLEGAEARAAVRRPIPLGPGFSEEVAERTDKLEVWGTRFSDPGPDRCKFVCFDEDGQVLASLETPGY